MSSVLMSVVPVLTGPNYQHWVSSMTSYLMSQGQWASVATECPKEVKRTKVEGETVIEDGIENIDEINKWVENNTRAVGNIRLCLHHTISFKFQEITWATQLWNELKDTYGQPGVAGVYMEFKAALDTTIPNNADPSLAIDKILAHFGRMAEGKASVPTYVQAMVLLAKIPPSMESLAQLFCQSEDKVEAIDTPKIRRAILLAWEQKGYRRNQNQGGQAQRITAIRRGPQEPEFTQQYDSGGFRGGRGRGGRGRPRGQRGQGGQKNPQNNVIQQDAQPTAGPSNHQQQRPPSAPPSEFDFGLFASPATLPPPSSVYPTFNKALSLARRLEVCPTIETLKRLETPFLENPRPHKKRNVSSDEEVSLGWTDDEVDAFMGESATASGSKTPGSAFDIDLFGTEERYGTNPTLEMKANPSTAFNNCRVNTPAAELLLSLLGANQARNRRAEGFRVAGCAVIGQRDGAESR